jgi:hypothetical protein
LFAAPRLSPNDRITILSLASDASLQHHVHAPGARSRRRLCARERQANRVMERSTALQIAYRAFLAALEGWRLLLGPRAWAAFVDMAARRLEAERHELAERPGEVDR